MANTTLANLITILQDNINGDISAGDMQTIISRLWETSVIDGTIDGRIPIFDTDIYGNSGTIIDSGYSINSLPLSLATINALTTKITYPTPLVNGLLQYNGVSNVSWVVADKDLVGLTNVDNTSDLDKPISTDTQAALDLKQDDIKISTTGAVNRVYSFGTGTETSMMFETSADIDIDLNQNITFSTGRKLTLPSFADEATAGSPSTNVAGIFFDEAFNKVKISDGTNWQYAANNGLLNGLTLSNNLGTPLEIINVSEGICADSTGERLIKLGSPISVKITDDIGVSIGGFPTNLTLNPATWYAVYICAKADGSDPVAVFDSNINSPSNAFLDLGIAYTLYRRIGWVGTETASIDLRQFHQTGDYFFLDVPEIVTDLSTTSGSGVTLACPRNVIADIHIDFELPSVTGYAYLCVSDTSGGLLSPSSSLYSVKSYYSGVYGWNGQGNIHVKTSNVSSVSHVSDTNGLDIEIMTNGWIDVRGIN